MTIITYGTFDLFHYGHYNLLKRARDMGDKLIVGVSTDEMCLKKGKKTVLNQKKRMEIISNLKFVDQVISEENMRQKIDDVKKYGVDVFVLGDDYEKIFPEMEEYGKLKAMGCKVVFLPRTPNISTTYIKNSAKMNNRL